MINKVNFAKNYQLVIVITLSFFAFYYVASTITGIVLNYTPVPHWDMWESVFLYSEIYHGHWPGLFSYYGEHPIALANIFYLMDASLFGARGIFLLSMSLLANSLIIIIFYKIISKSIPSSRYVPYFTSAVTCIMFSWMQTDNFNFPFQVQFFLVELVPLIAFYCLYKSKNDQSSFYTGATIILGLLSFETMAAGIFTFPILVLMACLFRMKKWLIAALAVLSVAIITFYLLTHHSSTYTPAAKFDSISDIMKVIKGFFTIWK